MGRRVAHVLVLLAGLVMLVWGVLLAINPTASCRGQAMGPGDTCYYASPTDAQTDRTQTYEERIATVRQNAPVVMGLGAAIALFGGGLYAQERRRTRAALTSASATGARPKP